MKDASYIRKLQKDIIEKDKAKKCVEGIIHIIEQMVINGYQEQKYSFILKDDSITLGFMDKIIDEFENLGFTAEFDYSKNIMTIFWNIG
jgi:hypothetical protein